MLFMLVVALAAGTAVNSEQFNSTSTASSSSTLLNAYDSEYGVFIGDLSETSNSVAAVGGASSAFDVNRLIKGHVYVVNETAIQIVNFTFDGAQAPDAFFWLDRGNVPTKDGLKIPSFEFGVTPLGRYENAASVVLILPGLHKISAFRSFALFGHKYEHNYGSVQIPEALVVPKPQFLMNELRGSRYNVGSGPILIIDRRTIKIFGFTFDGDKAPDGYFFVGRGPNVAYDAGVKVPIRGRDTPELITAMNERYRGGQDIITDLPDEYDINHIDWLSVYCYKFRVNFGHVPITNVSQRIPPYVAPQKRYDDTELDKVEGWPVNTLLGTEGRHNFTFQLGPPGGRRGYQSMARARAGKFVWYVNGYLADIYLKRGITYTFIVEGGKDKSTQDYYNPLYISNEPFGGYAKLSSDEREQVKVFAGSDPTQTAGRLCVWSQDNTEDDPDKYDNFIEYRRTLRLKCEEENEAAILRFTPNAQTPDTLYYQSYTSYNMGWHIHVVDEIPKDVSDFAEEPYEYEAWLVSQNLMDASSGVPLSSYSALLLLILLLTTTVLNF
ncbi:unnamed protein product [Anisakis simplex]|uniref:Protein Skeletor n=1 Tax=Anisakis simplex TaxID=6269 RepID=A0A0M3K183_ANISI|nr:unnamed protein product [Anisakis simplex]